MLSLQDRTHMASSFDKWIHNENMTRKGILVQNLRLSKLPILGPLDIKSPSG